MANCKTYSKFESEFRREMNALEIGVDGRITWQMGADSVQLALDKPRWRVLANTAKQLIKRAERQQLSY
jgi:hypothetical protein